jgi:hypothetical protein
MVARPVGSHRRAAAPGFAAPGGEVPDEQARPFEGDSPRANRILRLDLTEVDTGQRPDFGGDREVDLAAWALEADVHLALVVVHKCKIMQRLRDIGMNVAEQVALLASASRLSRLDDRPSEVGVDLLG